MKSLFCHGTIFPQMWNGCSASARKDRASLSLCVLLEGTSPCGEEEQDIQSWILTPTHVTLRVIVTSEVSLEKHWREIDQFKHKRKKNFLPVTKKGSTSFIFVGGHSRRLPEGVAVPLWWKGLIMFEGWDSSTHKGLHIDPCSSSFLTLLWIKWM